MNLTELKQEFEILFEEMATAGSKGLDDYEKSMCFTYAQEQIVESVLGSYEYGDRMRHILKPLLLKASIPAAAFSADTLLPEAPLTFEDIYTNASEVFVYTADPVESGEFSATEGASEVVISKQGGTEPLDYAHVSVGDYINLNASGVADQRHKVKSITEQTDTITVTTDAVLGPIDQTNPNTIFFEIDYASRLDQILQIVYEFLNMPENEFIPVIPLDTNDIHFTVKNPFREPDKTIAYRMTADDRFYIYTDAVDESNDAIFEEYGYIYCKYPEPVVLEGVTETINEQVWPNGNLPILPNSFQRNLVQAAVQFGIRTYVGVPERNVDQK